MTIRIFIGLAFFFFLLGAVHAQKVITEGMLSYTLSYPGMDKAVYEEYKDQMTSRQTYYFAPNKFRLEMDHPFGPVAYLTDLDTKRKVDLWHEDNYGEETKVAILTHEGFDIDQEIQALGKPEIELLKDKKRISGYKCKKAKITVRGEHYDRVVVVWYTQKVQLPQSKYMLNLFYYLEGLPVQFEEYNEVEEYATRLTLDKLEASPQPTERFTVPADYEWKEGKEFMPVMYD